MLNITRISDLLQKFVLLLQEKIGGTFKKAHTTHSPIASKLYSRHFITYFLIIALFFQNICEHGYPREPKKLKIESQG